jgi:geranylgeranyl pyrophosphate synthase
LRGCLGNFNLSSKDFARCQNIIESSGAKEYAEKRAEEEIATSLVELEKGRQWWNKAGHEFLQSMTEFQAKRTK